ncbi:MAG: hypothetical protein ABL959_24450, partial [Pyrinomonadaceae bacterium]
GLNNIAAVSFVLEYDPALGRPHVNLPSGGSSDVVLTVNDTKEGEIRILVDSSTALQGNARLLDVSFSTKIVGMPLTVRGVPNFSDALGNEPARR